MQLLTKYRTAFDSLSHATLPSFNSDLPLSSSPPSRFLEFRRVTLFYCYSLLFAVYFGLAWRSIFAVHDCVTLESFLRFTTPFPPWHAWRNLWTALTYVSLVVQSLFCTKMPRGRALVLHSGACAIYITNWQNIAIFVGLFMLSDVLGFVMELSCIGSHV